MRPRLPRRHQNRKSTSAVNAIESLCGVEVPELAAEDVGALRRGFDNLAKHVENVRMFFGQALFRLVYIA